MWDRGFYGTLHLDPTDSCLQLSNDLKRDLISLVGLSRATCVVVSLGANKSWKLPELFFGFRGLTCLLSQGTQVL